MTGSGSPHPPSPSRCPNPHENPGRRARLGPPCYGSHRMGGWLRIMFGTCCLSFLPGVSACQGWGEDPILGESGGIAEGGSRDPRRFSRRRMIGFTPWGRGIEVEARSDTFDARSSPNPLRGEGQLHTFWMIGVTQLKALKVERNGPTPLSPPSPRPKGPWGGGRKILAPMGNELRKSYR